MLNENFSIERLSLKEWHKKYCSCSEDYNLPFDSEYLNIIYCSDLDKLEVGAVNKEGAVLLKAIGESCFLRACDLLLEEDYFFVGHPCSREYALFVNSESYGKDVAYEQWRQLGSFSSEAKYQENIAQKALGEVRKIKSSRSYKLSNKISRGYRKWSKARSLLGRLIGKLRSIAYSRSAKKKKEKYRAFIEKIRPHLSEIHSGGEKAIFIDQWLSDQSLIVKRKELKECYWLYKDELPEVVVFIGWSIWRTDKSDWHIANTVKSQLTYMGSIYDLREFVAEIDKLSDSDEQRPLTYRIDDEIEKLKNGFPLPDRKYQRNISNNNVLYLLHNSLPYNSGGYATRTHGLLKGLKENYGFEIHGVTRPGYPCDHKKYINKKLPEKIPECDTVDNINYLRCDQGVRKSRLTISEYVSVYSKNIETLAERNETSIIHAASNFPNGFSAITAARHLGIKSVYEVRGLWEVTRLSRQPGWDETEQFKYMAKMEAEACKEADHAITITQALKELMISRGVPGNHISVVPNCVHTSNFTPLEKDHELARDLKIPDENLVIGYVGSIVSYEGLDDLLKSAKLLIEKRIKNFRVLIVGDGDSLDGLKKLTVSLGLEEYVIMTGRVPHSDVHKYYSLIDITPFPRKPYLVCEIVSPLKPFEAMASEKAVIVSSCSALTEIVEDGKTGMVYTKGDVNALASAIEKLINNSQLRKELGRKARRWVCENRDWKNGAEIVSGIYERLKGKTDC